MADLDYHSRMNRLHAAIDSGMLGDVDLVVNCTNRHDQPWQPVLRDRRSGLVELARLYSDGLIEFRGGRFPNNESNAA